MASAKTKTRSRLIVAALTALGALVVGCFLASGLFDSHYRVTVNFQPLFLVHPEMSVWKSGVQIGRVSSVQLLPDNQGINLVLELRHDVHIPQGETCRVIARSHDRKELAVEFIPPAKSTLISRFDGVTGAAKNNDLEPDEYAYSKIAITDGDYINGGVVEIDSPNLFDTSGR